MIARSITFDEVRAGDEVRAEKETGVIRALQGIVERSGGTGDPIRLSGHALYLIEDWSLTLLSRPTEVRPVGSLWQDPETDAVWVRRDDSFFQYTWISGRVDAGDLLDEDKHAEVIERLVPWSPAGTR